MPQAGNNTTRATVLLTCTRGRTLKDCGATTTTACIKQQQLSQSRNNALKLMYSLHQGALNKWQQREQGKYLQVFFLELCSTSRSKVWTKT